MNRLFEFGFDDQDIEIDCYGEERIEFDQGNVAKEEPQVANPTLHTLQDMVSMLPDRLSYNTINVKVEDGSTISIPRRELFDIRAQMMAEDMGSDKATIAGLSTDDITPNVYEGGFKTWECSVDLATYLATSHRIKSKLQQQDLHIIEACDSPSSLCAFPFSISTLSDEHRMTFKSLQLGVGTGLPILVLFHLLLETSLSSTRPKIRLTIADYNSSVLHLSTLPNLLLVWYASQQVHFESSSGDMEISPELLTHFFKSLDQRNIEVSFVSGAWSPGFVDLITNENSTLQYGSTTPVFARCETLVLASETIYSPSSMRPFTSTLLGLLTRLNKQGGVARGLVAAKKVYFGVGGGVDEFLRVLEEMEGEYKVIWEKEGEGVGRVILEVVQR